MDIPLCSYVLHSGNIGEGARSALLCQRYSVSTQVARDTVHAIEPFIAPLFRNLVVSGISSTVVSMGPIGSDGLGMLRAFWALQSFQSMVDLIPSIKVSVIAITPESSVDLINSQTLDYNVGQNSLPSAYELGAAQRMESLLVRYIPAYLDGKGKSYPHIVVVLTTEYAAVSIVALNPSLTGGESYTRLSHYLWSKISWGPTTLSVVIGTREGEYEETVAILSVGIQAQRWLRSLTPPEFASSSNTDSTLQQQQPRTDEDTAHCYALLAKLSEGETTIIQLHARVKQLEMQLHEVSVKRSVHEQLLDDENNQTRPAKKTKLKPKLRKTAQVIQPSRPLSEST